MIRISLALFMAAGAAIELGTAADEEQKYCRALALSGGASKGAFQAGAIYSLMHDGNPAEYKWDVIHGTSVGAINASMIGLWPKERGTQMSEYIANQWMTLTTKDVYEPWPENLNLSKFNIDNLQRYMRERVEESLDPKVGFRRLTSVGIASLPLMHYENIELDKIPKDEVVDLVPKAIVASSAMPYYFYPQDYQGTMMIDGGVRHVVDPKNAIERCLERVDDDETRVVLDVILLDDQGIDALECHDKPEQHGMVEVERAMKKYPHVRYRHLMAPKQEDLEDYDFLNFNRENTEKLLEAGKFDARKSMNLGAGYRFKQLRDLCEDK